MALITLDNGLDHTRPNTFGPKSLASLNAAIDAALDRDDVTSIGVTGKPFILAAGADLTGADRDARPRRRAADRPARPRRVPQARRGRQAVLRLRQRARARRRPRGRPALHLPHRAGLGARARPARGDARAGPRLGRRLPGAEPRRRRDRGEAGHREPAQPGQDPRRPRGLRGRAGRRRVPGRRLPGAVAAVGGPGAHRRGHRRAARGRPRRGLGRGRPEGPRRRRLQDRRGLPRRLPRAGPDRGRQDRDPRRGLRRRGRGARRPDA